MADFDSVMHINVARERAERRKQLKVGNTGTSGYRAPEVRSASHHYFVYVCVNISHVQMEYVCLVLMCRDVAIK